MFVLWKHGDRKSGELLRPWPTKHEQLRVQVSRLLLFTGHVLRIYDVDATRSRETRQTELRSRSRFDRQTDSGFHFKATSFQTKISFSMVKSSRASHFVINFVAPLRFHRRDIEPSLPNTSLYLSSSFRSSHLKYSSEIIILFPSFVTIFFGTDSSLEYLLQPAKAFNFSCTHIRLSNKFCKNHINTRGSVSLYRKKRNLVLLTNIECYSLILSLTVQILREQRVFPRTLKYPLKYESA